LWEAGIPTAYTFSRISMEERMQGGLGTKGLRELGFEQSKANICVFFQETTIFMVYMDYGIFIDPDCPHHHRG
jgi:hypothetical protein